VCKIVIDDGALAGPWQGDVYTVVSGDSLSRISDRMLGDTARWREIYNLNKKVVGSNPNKIDINMKLLLPPL
jgi:nucleoid-associated protein YgaU